MRSHRNFAKEVAAEVFDKQQAEEQNRDRESEAEAMMYYPQLGFQDKPQKYPIGGWGDKYSSWCGNPGDATAQELGIYTGDRECGYQPIASFNAG